MCIRAQIESPEIGYPESVVAVSSVAYFQYGYSPAVDGLTRIYVGRSFFGTPGCLIQTRDHYVKYGTHGFPKLLKRRNIYFAFVGHFVRFNGYLYDIRLYNTIL